MKSTVVDESLSSYKPMYCSREYQASTRLIQQYEKSTLNYTSLHLLCELVRPMKYANNMLYYLTVLCDQIMPVAFLSSAIG